jgi:hypothetical protein
MTTPTKTAGAKPTDKTAASTGSRSGGMLTRLTAALEQVEIHDQHDLHEFLEALRMLCHYLAVQVALASGEINAGAREMAKQQATMGMVGMGMRSRIRSVTKKIDAAADHLGDAAADAVGAWRAMEALLAELEPKTKVKRPKGFSINMN